MAANPRQGPSVPSGERKLSVAEARFYAAVFDSARKGSLAELRRAGCEEGEAEEAFTAAIERVMERVDPIARGFSEAQMVTYIKRTCWTELLAERRRRGLRDEIELGKARALGDPTSPDPEEIAETREALAIGREAVQMLPERDRLIFGQRHQMGLTPEEILQSTPGLSERTYRKIIQRANARVLDAYGRIRDGERCEEMRAGLLRRYVAEQSPEPERRAIEAHLAHCRACRHAQARMRGYLADVAGALLVASARADPGRGARERLREVLLRLATRLPGQGGEVAAGQTLGAPTLKVATACAGVAAGACLATGLVPGIGLSGHRDPAIKPAAQKAPFAPPLHPSLLRDTPSAPEVGSANGGGHGRSQSGHARESPLQASRQSTSSSRPLPPESYSTSEARLSGQQTGIEMGAESGGQPLPPPRTPTPTQPSAGSNSEPSAGSEPLGSSTASAEFGM